MFNDLKKLIIFIFFIILFVSLNSIFPQFGKLIISLYVIGFFFYFLFMARRIEVLDQFKTDAEKRFKEHEEVISELRTELNKKADASTIRPMRPTICPTRRYQCIALHPLRLIPYSRRYQRTHYTR